MGKNPSFAKVNRFVNQGLVDELSNSNIFPWRLLKIEKNVFGKTVVSWGALLNNKYACIHFHVHICNTSPLPPPSLKGKGTSTQALCSTYLLFKSGPLRPTFNYKYVLHPFSCAYMQHSSIATSFLKREGKIYSSIYAAHICSLKVGPWKAHRKHILLVMRLPT